MRDPRCFVLVLAACLCPAAWAQLTGAIDSLNCDSVGGYAWDWENPDVPVSVDVYTDTIWGGWYGYVTSGVANQFRTGYGYHSFNLPLGEAVRDGVPRVVYVYGHGWGRLDGSGWQVITCGPAGGYQYYQLNNLLPANWSQNGLLVAGPSGLTATDPWGGSWISTAPVPDGASEYEVKLTLALTASGGTYAAYLRASPDAMSGPPARGSYYSVELQNPVVSGNHCTATLAVNRRTGGVITLLGSTPVACHPETIVRAVRNPSSVTVWVDGVDYLTVADTSIASGKPGVGAWATPTGNSIERVDLGPLDRIAPSPVNPASVAVSALPNRVDLQWDPAVDDPTGVGAAYYNISRNGVPIASISGTEFSDAAVSPGATYTYTVQAVDYHFNAESTGATFNVTVPPSGSVDPRGVGLRPTGAYWGAGGEQIDTLSGNLNFTLPLLKAQGRGGWGVPFSLNYDSQFWRQEGGRDWKLGHDVGYGIGWRLQAGSLTPYWSGGAVHHYTFMDSSGAEYRLDVNTNGVWTSREGIYLEYDEASYRLYFPDGSFWLMGAVSAGAEQDSGTRYPTLMQDTNGNQLWGAQDNLTYLQQRFMRRNEVGPPHFGLLTRISST